MFEYAFMRRAFAVGLLLGVIMPCIGVMIVLKRLSMLGDALSHTSLAGVAAGLLLDIDPVLGATAACVAAAFGIWVIRKKIPQDAELSIAVMLSAGVGLAGVLSGFVQNAAGFNSFLFGSIVAITPGELTATAVISVLVLAAFVLLVSAASYTAQLNSTLKQLKKGKLLERAESEFHYLEGDRRSDALVSTAFLYGRRQNIVLPLADVLWVYRHDLKLLWAKRTVVELLTYDGRSITLRLERSGSRRTADAIVQAVATRNPEALVGLNRENQRLYSQQVPHAKRKRVWATAAGIGGGVLGYAIARVLIRLLLS